MKQHKKLKLLGAAIVSLLLIAAAILEVQYEVFIPNARIAPAHWFAAPACASVIVNTTHAAPIISNLMGDDAPPEWIINTSLPYELGILVSTDTAARHCTATCYVNTRRLTPLLLQRLNAAIPETYGRFTLTSNDAVESPDGIIQWSMSAPLDAAVVARAARSATSKETRTGAENTGDHLIEVVLDNRSGGLYPLFEVLLAGPIVMPDGSPIDADELAEFIGKVDTITAAADYHAGVCSVNVELTCAAEASATDVEMMHSLLSFCSHFVAATLRETYSASVHGDALVYERSVRGAYTVTNLERAVESLHGRVAPKP